LKLCQGKTQQNFTGDEDSPSFFSGLNEDGRSSTAVTTNYGKACPNDAVATSVTTRRNAGKSTGSANKPNDNMLT